MKTHRPTIAALVPLIALTFGVGCVKTPEDPNDPDNPVWNPIDANAPPGLFPPPKARITSGPQDGTVWPQDSVTFRWDKTTPNIVAYVWLLDGKRAPAPDAATSKTFTNLDEGPHEFRVLARYSTGLETPPDSAERRRFTVNALSGMTVYLSPRADTVEANTDFAVEVRAANFARVDSERVKGVRLVFSLPTSVTYNGLDTLGFLNGSGGRAFFWTARQGNFLTFEAARVGDPAASPADSGAVLRLRLRAGVTVSADSMRIVECEVFNGNNSPLRSVATRGAKIEVR